MTGGVGGLGTIGGQNLNQYGIGAAETQRASAAKPGSGALASGGQVPDAAPRPGMNAAMASLTAMMPKMNGAMVDVMLLEVVTKMKDTISASEKDKIKSDSAAKKAQIEEKQAKLAQAEEKIAQAAEKMKNLSIWDKIKIAFQYVAAIATFVAGAVMAFTGVGLAGGIALMAAGALLLTLAIDATFAATREDGLGLVGAAVKDAKMNGSPPMSEEDAMKEATKADMIARIVVSVAAAILSIAGGYGAVGLVKTAMAVAGGVTSVATGVGDAVVGGLKYQATQVKAEGMGKQAEGKAMAAVIQMLDDAIDQQLTRLKGATERFDAMLDALTEAAKDRGETMARVGLRA